MIVGQNLDMALSIYLKVQASEKVINCFTQKGEFDKIVTYAARVGYRVDYRYIIYFMVDHVNVLDTIKEC